MPRLSPTSWQTQVRQRGSHLVYDHPQAKRPVVIPRYEEVPTTVIRANMRTVGMTREEYFKLLQDP